MEKHTGPVESPVQVPEEAGQAGNLSIRHRVTLQSAGGRWSFRNRGAVGRVGRGRRVTGSARVVHTSHVSNGNRLAPLKQITQFDIDAAFGWKRRNDARVVLPPLPPDGNRSEPFGFEVLDSNRVIALAQVDVSE